MSNVSCSSLGLSEPIKFLGLTVLSFNTTLGWGTQESTLSVDLIEDCENEDSFIGQNLIGFPVYFNAGDSFSFNGILVNWTKNTSQGGQTYNVKVNDPRSLLELAEVVVDSYCGPPQASINYFNVYAFYEQGVYNGDCATFGNATNGTSIERGMPYKKIVDGLIGMNPSLCSSTGAIYTINLTNLNTLSMPDFFRASGPSLSILQIVQDICDANGADFYVTLAPGGIITVHPIVLVPQGGMDNLVDTYKGLATELGYGRELRNEKVKTLIFGGQQHYLNTSSSFKFYFGEDKNGNPIYPKENDECGFIIDIDITALNLSLFNPLPTNFTKLHELDIRAAMSSEAMWKTRAFQPQNNLGLNGLIQAAFPEMADDIAAKAFPLLAGNKANEKVLVDALLDIRKPIIDGEKFELANEIGKIHKFVENIGNTFYGKQFLVSLDQLICIKEDPDAFREKLYSDVPTNDGGWVEEADIGTAITLNCGNPEIGIFMQDDGRIGAFAQFTKDAMAQPSGAIPGGSSLPTPTGTFFNGSTPTPPTP